MFIIGEYLVIFDDCFGIATSLELVACKYTIIEI